MKLSDFLLFVAIDTKVTIVDTAGNIFYDRLLLKNATAQDLIDICALDKKHFINIVRPNGKKEMIIELTK